MSARQTTTGYFTASALALGLLVTAPFIGANDAHAAENPDKTEFKEAIAKKPKLYISPEETAWRVQKLLKKPDVKSQIANWDKRALDVLEAAKTGDVDSIYKLRKMIGNIIPHQDNWGIIVDLTLIAALAGDKSSLGHAQEYFWREISISVSTTCEIFNQAAEGNQLETIFSCSNPDGVVVPGASLIVYFKGQAAPVSFVNNSGKNYSVDFIVNHGVIHHLIKNSQISQISQTQTTALTP